MSRGHEAIRSRVHAFFALRGGSTTTGASAREGSVGRIAQVSVSSADVAAWVRLSSLATPRFMAEAAAKKGGGAALALQPAPLSTNVKFARVVLLSRLLLSQWDSDYVKMFRHNVSVL
jgi:hypothetical protein